MAEQPEAENAESGGGKKPIILFAVVLVVAIGASVGGTLYFLGGEEEAPQEVTAPSNIPVQAIYHNLRPAFIVNFVSSNKPRLMQLELSVMSRNPAVIEAIVNHTPLVRARILSYLNDQDFFDLQTNAGKESLREGIRALLDTLLVEVQEPKGLEAVFITNFVMQ